MLYCLVLFLPGALAEKVQPLRERYDPTALLIDPHLTLVFPARIRQAILESHVVKVLDRWSQFEIRFCGLSQSWDQWLFLDLDEISTRTVTRLHDELYVGPLARHLSPSIPYKPHVGIGHFGLQRDRYNPLNPRSGSLDEVRYRQAHEAASMLAIDSRVIVQTLDVISVDDAVTHVERMAAFALHP